MATYTPVSVSNYNQSPPPDDGTTVSANKATWAGVKTKLTDPLNTAIASLDTNVAAAFAVLDTAWVPIKDPTYGAIGDGIADDTTAFNNLEADYSGYRIDLLGLTYLVTAVPVGNFYYNGSFKIGSTTYPQDNTDTLKNLPRTNFHSAAYDSATWDEIQAEGGDYHAFPLITRQPETGRILAVWMHQTQHSSGQPEDVVCKYSDDGGASWSSLIVIYGTLNGTDAVNPYADSLGVDRYGRFVVIFGRLDANLVPYITRSWDGITWSTPVLITYTGDTINTGNSLFAFNGIHALPSGKLAVAFYQSDTITDPASMTRKCYVGVIDDDVSETSVEMRLITSRPRIDADSAITFTAPDKVNDSANRLGTFEVGDRFAITGSTLNSAATWQVTAVAAGQLTVTGAASIQTESGETPTLTHNINEPAFVPVTENLWFAALRLNGPTSRVGYYSTVDAGTTWVYEGFIQENTSEIGGGWIPQSGVIVTIDDVRHVMFAIGLRDSGTDPTHPTTTPFYSLSSIQYYICPVSKALGNSGVWRRIWELSYTTDGSNRDVYTSQVVDDITGEILTISHEETASDESRITTARWNYREKASRKESWDATLEGTGGTANTYTGTPVINTVKRGPVVHFNGRLVLSAKNATGSINVAGFPYTCIDNNGYSSVAGYTVTPGGASTYLRSAYGLRIDASAKTMSLIDQNANASIDHADIDAAFDLRFSGMYFTDD